MVYKKVFYMQAHGKVNMIEIYWNPANQKLKLKQMWHLIPRSDGFLSSTLTLNSSTFTLNTSTLTLNTSSLTFNTSTLTLNTNTLTQMSRHSVSISDL